MVLIRAPRWLVFLTSRAQSTYRAKSNKPSLTTSSFELTRARVIGEFLKLQKPASRRDWCLTKMLATTIGRKFSLNNKIKSRSGRKHNQKRKRKYNLWVWKPQFKINLKFYIQLGTLILWRIHNKMKLQASSLKTKFWTHVKWLKFWPRRIHSNIKLSSKCESKSLLAAFLDLLRRKVYYVTSFTPNPRLWKKNVWSQLSHKSLFKELKWQEEILPRLDPKTPLGWPGKNFKVLGNTCRTIKQTLIMSWIKRPGSRFEFLSDKQAHIRLSNALKQLITMKWHRMTL
jgi:hypothetical protein